MIHHGGTETRRRAWTPSTPPCLRASVVILLFCSFSFAQTKKLIEFGWDEPDTAFMRAHVAEMEKTPFDGCVFHATATDAQGKAVAFLWEGWGKRAFTRGQLQASLDELTPANRAKPMKLSCR